MIKFTNLNKHATILCLVVQGTEGTLLVPIGLT